MKKAFGWLIIALSLGCFALALVTIAARFGGDVMVICLLSGIGFGAMGIGNKMIA